ncbi:MAG TPA: SWIM zinc finger family protein [Thermoanaerobaculia bacterium]|nr:SWIM zinc finger family protein [Thermoanaerobaculia bacterium]
MASAAQLLQTYRYPFASHVDAGYGLRLATSGTQEDANESPYFFEGRLARPDELSDMLLVLSELVRSRFYIPGAMRQIDPVVTSSEAALRFEGFSSCCGVYGRADFTGEAFESGIRSPGTTNVDFNSPMRGALGRLRTGGEARLAVGAEEVKLASEASGSVVEKKVKLPHRWVKGFTEVQAYLPRLRTSLEVSALEAQRFLRALPRGGAPKEASWVVPSGKSLRLSKVASRDGVKVAGTDRLRLFEPIAGRAKRMRVWSDEETGVSAWELIFETGRMWIALSPDISRGFSGEGQVLTQLAAGEWEGAVHRVRAELRWQSMLDVEEVASRAGLTREEVGAALAVLSARGLVGYDSAASGYFHRELPFDLSKVEQLHPRLKDARAIVAAGALRWQERNGVAGECFVRGTEVEHVVRLTENEDRCTCRWFSRNQGERGPCKHILAARIDLEGDDD